MTRAAPRRLLLLVLGLVAASLGSAGCTSLIGVPEVPDAADDGGGDAGGTPDSSSAPVDAGAPQ